MNTRNSFVRTALLLLALVLAGVAVPVRAASPAPSTSPVPSATAPRIALLLEGAAGDQGVADALIQGLIQAQKDFGIAHDIIVLPEAASMEDAAEQQEAAFKRTSASHTLVLLPSPALHELLMNNAGNYRRTRFGCLLGEVKAPNIASVTFADSEAAFLSGAAAAMLTTQTLYPGINNERILGWVGAYETPSQKAELEAFLQGARLIHPETRVLVVFTGTTSDPEAGRKAALNIYARGADIVAHSAGRAGLGVLAAAREQKRYAIGHSVDQAAVAEGHVLFSQLRRLDEAAYVLAQAVKENTFPGNTTKHYTLANKGVGLSSLDPLQQRMGKAFPAELPQRLREIAYEIERGGITPPVVRKKTLCDCL